MIHMTLFQHCEPRYDEVLGHSTLSGKCAYLCRNALSIHADIARSDGPSIRNQILLHPFLHATLPLAQYLHLSLHMQH